MFLLVAALAHAGLRADIERVAGEGPELAIACTSAREALTRFETLAGELEGAGGKPFPRDSFDSVLRMQEVMAPDARLTVAWWQGGGLDMGFDTALDAGALAEGLARIAPGASVAEPGPEGWRVLHPDGTALLVGVEAGVARVRSGEPRHVQRALPAGFSAALPEGPGCVIVAHMADDTFGQVDVGVHLPFAADGPIHLAFAGDELQDSPAVLLGGATPPRVSTVEVPEAVAVLGIGLDSIDFSAFLEGKELRDARRIQNLFPVTGGTTVALVSSNPPRVAAVLPFAGRLSAAAVARRTLRVARAAEIEVQRVDATHLTLELDDLTILAATAPGTLYLSTDPGTLNAIQGGAGTPWVSGDLAALAAEWPVLLSSRVLPGVDGEPTRALPRPLTVAVDFEGNVLRGRLDLPLTLAELAAIVGQVRDARKAAADGDPGGE